MRSPPVGQKTILPGVYRAGQRLVRGSGSQGRRFCPCGGAQGGQCAPSGCQAALQSGTARHVPEARLQRYALMIETGRQAAGWGKIVVWTRSQLLQLSLQTV
ncbi:MAG: hypothetical protein WBK55_05195 [Alphaproteobacteria bacterium]